MKTVVLLTGNKRKKESLEKAAVGYDIKTEIVNPWLPEIQELDTAKVAAFAASFGADLLKKPVIKMDSGFYIYGLNGFPGSLVHAIDEYVGVEYFFEILKNLKNRKALIKNSLAFCEPGKKPVIFNSECKGIIPKELESKEGSLIDQLFIPTHAKNQQLRTLGQIRKENPELLPEIWGDAELQFIKWVTK